MGVVSYSPILPAPEDSDPAVSMNSLPKIRYTTAVRTPPTEFEMRSDPSANLQEYYLAAQQR
jgi:hypothetical protein